MRPLPHFPDPGLRFPCRAEDVDGKGGSKCCECGTSGCERAGYQADDEHYAGYDRQHSACGNGREKFIPARGDGELAGEKVEQHAQDQEKENHHSLKKRAGHNVLLRIPEVLAGQ